MNSTRGPEPGNPPTSATEVETAVASHPFLEGLAPEVLRTLASNAMLVHYDAGDWIFRQGEPANRFYLIQRGKVALEAANKNGERVLIQILGPDDVLGWSWLFPPYLWQFDARAIEPIDAIFFYGTRLREQCEENNAMGYALVKRMVSAVIRRLMFARKQLMDAGK